MWIETPIRLALALLAGALASTAFAPLAWWWSLALSLLLLWQLWYARPGWAAACGFFWGMGHFGTGVYWLFNSLYYFGNAHWLTAVLMTFAFVVYLSLFPALAGVAWSALARAPLMRWPGLQLGTLVGLWWLSEYLRTNVVFGGFPWLASGYTQLHGFARDWFAVVGVPGAGWLYLLIIAGVHTGIRRWWGSRPLFLTGVSSGGGENQPGGGALRAPYIVLACAGALLLWLTGRALPEWTAPRGEAIQVGVLHTDMPQQDKQRAAAVAGALSTMLSLSQDSQSELQLLVWPETSIPFYADSSGGSFLRQIDNISQQQNSWLLAGVFYRDAQRRVYNAVYASGDGHSDYYLKQRLVPFGEYMPARWAFAFLEDWIDIPQSDLWEGPENPPPLQAHGMRVHASVCYELFFADMIHAQARQSGLLVNVSNDAWFGRAVAPAQSLEMTRVRSLESGRSVLRASNQGISAITDERGRVLARADGDYQLITASVSPRAGQTPVVRFGQTAIVVLILLAHALLWTLYYWRARSPGAVARQRRS